MTDKEKLIERITALLLEHAPAETSATRMGGGIVDWQVALTKAGLAILASAIAQAWLEDVEKRETATKHHLLAMFMSTPTEGLFDNGGLFIKRRPLEQMWINEVGYEVFKATQEGLPKLFGEETQTNE